MKIIRNICTRTKGEKYLEYNQNFKIVQLLIQKKKTITEQYHLHT